MGWYHDANFSWDDVNPGAAPACSLNNRPPPESAVAPPEAPLPAAQKPSSATSGNTACPLPADSPPPPPPPDVASIYHLCLKSNWMEAVESRKPYFPPTFMADGKFTRATVHKRDLVSTANEYYKDTPGDWIVLELDCDILFGLGIPILAQQAPESTPKAPVQCLQVFGGISTTLRGLVLRTHRMLRYADGTFARLIECTSRVPVSDATEEKKQEDGSQSSKADITTGSESSQEKSSKKGRRFWPKLK